MEGAEETPGQNSAEETTGIVADGGEGNVNNGSRGEAKGTAKMEDPAEKHVDQDPKVTEAAKPVEAPKVEEGPTAETGKAEEMVEDAEAGKVEDAEPGNGKVEDAEPGNGKVEDAEAGKDEEKAEEGPTPKVEEVKPAAPLKPALRGHLKIGEGQIPNWIGQWGMDDKAFEAGGTVSDFHYKFMKFAATANMQTDRDAQHRDSYYSGHFMMGSLKEDEPPSKHAERNLLFKFTKDPSSADGTVMNVMGTGSNAFGKFTLEGKLNVETKEMNCYRTYIPKEKRNRKRKPSVTPGVGGAAMREKRVRRQPVNLDTIGEDTKMPKMHKLVHQVIMNDKMGWFTVPVDPVAHNCPNYLQVIKHPMDLGTVQTKLRADEYSSEDQVLGDIRLVFSNAMKFNPPVHPVHKVAAQHLVILERELEKLRAPPRKGSRVKRKSTKPGGISDSDEEFDDEDLLSPSSREEKRDRSRSKKKQKRSSGGAYHQQQPAGGAESSEIAMLKNQLSQISEQLQLVTQLNAMQNQHSMLMSTQPAIGLPPAGNPRAAPARAAPAPVQRKKEVRPLSYQEKRQLGQDINCLGEDEIVKVVEIIQESGGPLGKDDEDIELDIDSLDTPTLKKLQKFVKQAKNRMKKQALQG